MGVYMQCGGYTPVNTHKSWNHVNSVQSGEIIADMVDDTGAATGFSFTYAQNPTQQSTSGINATGSGDSAWVDEAGISQTFHYVQNGAAAAIVTFAGLDDAKTYTIEIYSSWNSGSGNRRLEASVNNFTTSVVVEAQGNTTEVARISDVSPSGNQIALAWRPLGSDSHAHCNAIFLQENEAGGGATGALSETEENDSVSASGLLVFSAASSAAEANDTLSASGGLVLSGSVSESEAGDTLSASGLFTSGISGALTETEAGDTALITGLLVPAGAMAITEADDTLNASGTGGEVSFASMVRAMMCIVMQPVVKAI